MIRSLTLQRALLATVGLAILAGIVPAGIALDRRLANALEARARTDLALAPRVLADRSAANSDAMMMHAKDFAHADGLADALLQHDRVRALAVAEASRASVGEIAVIVDAAGESWAGPSIDSALVAQTRAGKMPVVVQRIGQQIRNVALAPVERDGRWVGAAGLIVPVDERTVGVLSGLTRSDVVILSASTGMVAASTLDSTTAREVAAAVIASGAAPVSGEAFSASSASSGSSAAAVTMDITAHGTARVAIIAPLSDAARVVFTRAISDELAILPELRRVAFISALAALIVALALGAWLATRVSRPVRQLSQAASALTAGEFHAPLPTSRIREVEQVASTFDAMRQALAARLADLRSVNEALVDRNARLTTLQADLMQRDRLNATGRLVTQLAHEIRNPVANLRNCLELIRRRVGDDEEALQFANLAIDELLRMHELAEQMLDLNRPRDPLARSCRPVLVSREVVTLSSVGHASNTISFTHDIADTVEAALSPDALKQVLLNLVQNAREAYALGAQGAWGGAAHHDAVNTSGDAVRIELTVSGTHADVIVEVRDNGPGIPPAILNRIFDPFFTTKEAVHGVGLGLFVAEGLVRTAGGRLAAGNRTEGGAWFRIALPYAREVRVSDAVIFAVAEGATR
jgi:signal transduction histidine kinase